MTADDASSRTSSQFKPTILVEMYSNVYIGPGDLKKMVTYITDCINEYVIEPNKKTPQDFK